MNGAYAAKAQKTVDQEGKKKKKFNFITMFPPMETENV